MEERLKTYIKEALASLGANDVQFTLEHPSEFAHGDWATNAAMVAAKKRGVDVRLVTDRQRTEDVKQRTALQTLHLAGIPILVNAHDGLMHVKQVVIDDEVNTTGSMNHTTSGNRYNDERLDVITDHAMSVKAREKFLAMWNDHSRYRAWGQP
jgi:phosphatidylserine/phosphatidylglycerophosphate/cardiolipin synthase-like enzyme